MDLIPKPRKSRFQLWIMKDMGGVTELSKLLGVTIGAVSRWKNRSRIVDLETARKIVELSNGALTIVDLFDHYFDQNGRKEQLK